MKIELTIEEIKDLLSLLDQCESEGCMRFRDPAYKAMNKLQSAFENEVENAEKDE